MNLISDEKLIVCVRRSLATMYEDDTTKANRGYNSKVIIVFVSKDAAQIFY